MKAVFLLFAAVLLAATPATSATYYVTNDGNDSLAGTSEGTAWQTISKVNGSSFAAGDSIKFKRGDTWREHIVLPYGQHGASGNPITITSYGTGAKPKILGSVQPGSWDNNATNIYTVTGITVEPTAVWFNDTWGTYEAGGLGGLDADKEWYWAANKLYVYSTSDPAARNVEIPQGDDSCISTNYNKYRDFKNMEIAYCNYYGIRIRDEDATTHMYNNMDNCTLHHIGAKDASDAEGIFIRAAYSNATNNTIHNAGNHGIYVVAISSDDNITTVSVTGNTIYDCYHTGIDVMNIGGALTNVTVARNHLYSSPTYDTTYTNNAISVTGVAADHKATNTSVHYNVVRDVITGGIYVSNYVDTVNIYNNTVAGTLSGYGDWSVCFRVQGTGQSGVTIKNNAGYNCNSIVFYTSDSTAISSVDYNLWYTPGAGILTFVDSGYWYVADWSDYKSSTGYDSHSPTPSDPRFVSATNQHLMALSPCIDSGYNLGLTTDFDGVVVMTPPDIGAYQFTAPPPGVVVPGTSGGCRRCF